VGSNQCTILEPWIREESTETTQRVRIRERVVALPSMTQERARAHHGDARVTRPRAIAMDSIVYGGGTVDVSELVAEYSTGRRTVHQEMLYRQLKRCCGDCTGWFHGWAQLLHMRNIEDREPMGYFHMEVPEFKAHVRACETAMEDADRVDSCIAGLEGLWDKEWRNPRDNRITRGRADEKARQYRTLFGGKSSGRCIEPDYRIEG
jgi:hypothetical protein